MQKLGRLDLLSWTAERVGERPLSLAKAYNYILLWLRVINAGMLHCRKSGRDKAACSNVRVAKQPQKSH